MKKLTNSLDDKKNLKNVTLDETKRAKKETKPATKNPLINDMESEKSVKLGISSKSKDKATNYRALTDVEKKIVSVVERAVSDLSQKVKKNQKPSILFISGFDYFGLSPDDSNGILKLSKALPDSKHFYWDQKDEILKEIKKHSAESPLILVGHSFGGDSAVEIADELNQLSHNFRKIDLLVTLDSVGRNNDLIPENVKTNLHFFGNKNFILNDGPNAAFNRETTSVHNFLRQEDHSQIDDSEDVQRMILETINEEILGSGKENFRNDKESSGKIRRKLDIIV